MADPLLDTQNQQALLQELESFGIPNEEVGAIVAPWTKPAPVEVNFKTSFPETDTDCRPKFVRQFVHKDWRDGIDVVQAATTNGFNDRFHAIENDLDNLALDTQQVYECLAEQRASLYALLREIRGTFDAFAYVMITCCEAHAAAPSGPVKIVAAMPVGEENILLLWSAALGYVAVQAPYSIHVPTPGQVEFGIDGLVMTAKYFAENPALKKAVGTGITKTDLVAQFGKEQLGINLTLENAISMLPAHATYRSTAGVVEALVSSFAAGVQATGNRDQFLASALGNDAAAGAAAPVASLTVLPEDVAKALTKAETSTVGALAKLSVTSLTAALGKADVPVSSGDAQGYIAAAGVVSALG